MATQLVAAAMFVTKDDLEVIDECLDFQLRTLRNKVFTTWKDKEYYDKVMALRKEVEGVLECFAGLEALKEEEEEEE